MSTLRHRSFIKYRGLLWHYRESLLVKSWFWSL